MTDQEQPAAGVALKPCPFCGGSDLAVETYSVQPDEYHSGYVKCADCDAEGGRPESWLGNKDEARAEAIAVWNRHTRAPTDAGGAVSEAARAVVKAHGASVCGSFDSCDAPGMGGGCLGDTLHNAVVALAAALTPAPQAEGDGKPDAWRWEQFTNLSGVWTPRLTDDRPDDGPRVRNVRPLFDRQAPQPLQQGGEVTREHVARVIAPDAWREYDDEVRDCKLWGEDLNPVPSPGRLSSTRASLKTADAILALFASLSADRDKAVGLLRDAAAHLPTTGPLGDRLSAFLSSQTEGR